ncbi:hypothetical protein ACTXT7_013848 [Hymenolepis weldensis]
MRLQNIVIQGPYSPVIAAKYGSLGINRDVDNNGETPISIAYPSFASKFPFVDSRFKNLPKQQLSNIS